MHTHTWTQKHTYRLLCLQGTRPDSCLLNTSTQLTENKNRKMKPSSFLSSFQLSELTLWCRFDLKRGNKNILHAEMPHSALLNVSLTSFFFLSHPPVSVSSLLFLASEISIPFLSYQIDGVAPHRLPISDEKAALFHVCASTGRLGRQGFLIFWNSGKLSFFKLLRDKPHAANDSFRHNL